MGRLVYFSSSRGLERLGGVPISINPCACCVCLGDHFPSQFSVRGWMWGSVCSACADPNRGVPSASNHCRPCQGASEEGHKACSTGARQAQGRPSTSVATGPLRWIVGLHAFFYREVEGLVEVVCFARFEFGLVEVCRGRFGGGEVYCLAGFGVIDARTHTHTHTSSHHTTRATQDS